MQQTISIYVFYRKIAMAILLWLSVASWSRSQAQAMAEVDVVVHLFALDGQASPELRSSDFRLTQTDSQISFELQRFTSPNAANTYALFDLVHCSTTQALATGEVAQELDSMFRLGWHVSMLQPDGSQTLFAASTQELANTQKVPGRSEEIAVRSLNENAGLHLVFAPCISAGAIPPEVVGASNQALAAFFTIVPGAALYSTNENPSQEVVIISNDQQTASFSAFGGLTRSRLTPRGRPLDQPTAADAVATAQLFASEFYSLHIRHLASFTPITLKLHIPGRSQVQYRIVAEAYSDGVQVPQVIVAK